MRQPLRPSRSGFEAIGLWSAGGTPSEATLTEVTHIGLSHDQPLTGGDWPDGIGCRRYGGIDSTHAEAMRQAAAGAAGPTWLTSTLQTAGRGRSGRTWTSETGNLYASYLFMPGCAPSQLHHLAFLAGIAAHDALAVAVPALAPGSLRLKWPNDVLLDGAKLGGILVEVTTFGTKTVAVIGVGLNLAHHPGVAGYASTSLADCGHAVTPDAMLSLLAQGVDRWLKIWHEGRHFAAVRSAWLMRGPVLGDQLTVTTTGTRDVRDQHVGAFAGLDSDGALLLSQGHQGPLQRFTWGDVSLGWSAVTAANSVQLQNSMAPLGQSD